MCKKLNEKIDVVFDVSHEEGPFYGETFDVFCCSETSDSERFFFSFECYADAKRCADVLNSYITSGDFFGLVCCLMSYAASGDCFCLFEVKRWKKGGSK